jgi:ABC-2 type transport system ATP-binding protein
MIEVKGLRKSFDDFEALRGLDIKIDKGSVFGLIGVNGSGKTTLFKHMTGVLRPDEGSVLFDGEDVYENPSVKARMGYVPDELFFFQGYGIKDMARFYSHVYPYWNEQRCREMVESFDLPANKNIGKFSKGMQKQAAFILTMSAMPDYLILDEPMDGLDPLMRKKVWGYVLNDVAERGLTVVVSSHNLRELEGICDSVGILSRGKLVFTGKLDELKGEAKDMSIEELFMYEMGGAADEQ